MLRRAFTHFPLRFTTMAVVLTIYAVFGTLYGLFKFPPISIINLIRKYGGGFAVRLIINVREEFDTK